jgi:hypothetical protein
MRTLRVRLDAPGAGPLSWAASGHAPRPGPEVAQASPMLAGLDAVLRGFYAKASDWLIVHAKFHLRDLGLPPIKRERTDMARGPKNCFQPPCCCLSCSLFSPSLTRWFCLFFFHLARIGEALPVDTLHHKHHAFVLLIPSTTPPYLAGPRRRRRCCAVRVQRSDAPPVVALGSDHEDKTLVRLRRPGSSECFHFAIYKGM